MESHTGTGQSIGGEHEEICSRRALRGRSGRAGDGPALGVDQIAVATRQARRTRSAAAIMCGKTRTIGLAAPYTGPRGRHRQQQDATVASYTNKNQNNTTYPQFGWISVCAVLQMRDHELRHGIAANRARAGRRNRHNFKRLRFARLTLSLCDVGLQIPSAKVAEGWTSSRAAQKCDAQCSHRKIRLIVARRCNQPTRRRSSNKLACSPRLLRAAGPTVSFDCCFAERAGR